MIKTDNDILFNRLKNNAGFYRSKKFKDTMKIKVKTGKKLKKECDDLWAECVKARAGYKSELSEKTEHLNAHHIAKKPNLYLRYLLENGICLTEEEHIYGIHSDQMPIKVIMENRIKKIRGENIYQELVKLKHKEETRKLTEIKLYLSEELAKLK